MKTKKIIATSLFFLSLSAAFPSMAEWHPAQESRQNEPSKTRRETRMERMARELKLSKDQQEKIEAAFKARDAKMDALQTEFRAKRDVIHKEAGDKVMIVLTPEQKQAYKNSQQERLLSRASKMGTKTSTKKN